MTVADGSAGTSAPELSGAQIRETAKWLTVSLAALGAVLVAGSQLSDLGSLKPWGGRFWWALSGAGVAAAGTGAILALSIWVATTPHLGMTQILRLGEKHGALKDLWTDRRALFNHDSMTELAAAHTKALKERDAALVALAAKPPPNPPPDLAGLNARLKYIDQVVSGVRKTATYRLLSWRWRRAGVGLIGAGLLVGAGIGVFAWAANPPEDVVASSLNPTVLAKPTVAKLTLTEDGQEALRHAAGKSCRLNAPVRVLVLGKTAAGVDVLVQQKRCSVIRFVVVPAWGSLAT